MKTTALISRFSGHATPVRISKIDEIPTGLSTPDGTG